jgi:DNA modification methylase
MNPYYQDDAVTIYHGDTLEVMNDLEAPVVAAVTDPPYASGARQEAQRNASGAMLRGQRWAAKPIENDQMTTTGFVWLMREVCYHLRPMLVDGGSLLSFIDWRQWPTLVGAVESTNLRVNGMVVWDKMSYGLGNGFRAQHELILFASKGTPRVADRGTSNVLAFRREANDDHPSPKPVPLMRALIGVVSDPGDLLLDPFMGAGATLVAARDTGRRAIGIEIEERYCEIAANRCAQDVLFGASA